MSDNRGITTSRQRSGQDSTVDDWHGQEIARDFVAADEALTLADGDESAAAEIFEDIRPPHPSDQFKVTADERREMVDGQHGKGGTRESARQEEPVSNDHIDPPAASQDAAAGAKVPNEDEAAREFPHGDGRPLREQLPLTDDDGDDIRQYTGEPVETEQGWILPQQMATGTQNVVGGGEFSNTADDGVRDHED